MDYAVSGYETNVTGSVENFTITNTLIPTTIDIGVKKTWIDAPGQDASVTILLLSDLETEGQQKEVGRVTLTAADAEASAADTWACVFESQPLFAEDDRLIEYTVQEEIPEGWNDPIIIDNGDAFVIMNWQVPDKKTVIVSKVWEGDEKDRPSSVTVHLMDGDNVLQTKVLNAENEWTAAFTSLDPTDAGGREIKYTVSEDEIEGYTAKLDKEVYEEWGLMKYQITNSPKAPEPEPEPEPEPVYYTIKFDPNGGTINGSEEPLTLQCAYDEEIVIPDAPLRDGDWYFDYWQGSEYYPGDRYIVKGDHNFKARWVRDGGYTYKFTFSKVWKGGAGDSIDWTLYAPNGSVVHKKFNKEVVSDTEWAYEAWFASEADYYIVENVPAGYKVSYKNVGKYSDVTDRCYNGGTIINTTVPKTGDQSHLLLWISLVLLGSLGLLLLRRRN